MSSGQLVQLAINSYPAAIQTGKHPVWSISDHQSQLTAKLVNAMITLECTVLPGAQHCQ